MRTGLGYWLVYARRKARHPNIVRFRRWIETVAHEMDRKIDLRVHRPAAA